MATQEYAASIQGVSIRVTRLDAAGNLMTGPGNSYTTSAFMRISFTPEYEEGDEITEKGANGVVCVTYKAPDTLKRITMELAICEPDPELSALISGGLLLRKNLGTADDPNNKSIGYASPGVGDDPSGNGVAIEAWSHAIKDGKKAGVLPYFHWVFPYVKMRLSGDRVIENGLLANTFEGYGLGNSNFGSGIDGRWEFPVAAERPYSYARTDWAPTGLSGFYTWTDGSGQMEFTTSSNSNPTTVTISSVAGKATDDTAEVTFSAAHGLAQGDKIVVSNVGPAFNGEKTITALVGSDVVKFALNSSIEDDITATLTRSSRITVKQSVTETFPNPTPVTSLTPTTEGEAYNVPGSVTYNESAALDYIITSNEN